MTSRALAIPSWKALSAVAFCLRMRSSSASLSMRSEKKHRRENILIQNLFAVAVDDVRLNNKQLWINYLFKQIK